MVFLHEHQKEIVEKREKLKKLDDLMTIQQNNLRWLITSLRKLQNNPPTDFNDLPLTQEAAIVNKEILLKHTDELLGEHN